MRLGDLEILRRIATIPSLRDEPKARRGNLFFCFIWIASPCQRQTHAMTESGRGFALFNAHCESRTIYII